MKKYLYNLISKFGFKIENRKKEKNKRLLYLSKYEVVFNKEMLLKGYDVIRAFEGKFSDIKIKDEKEGLLFSFNGITIYIESFEEFFILNEVFYLNEYNFYSNQKTIVVDIGTNIGIASLFFSGIDSVDKIYSYEPVLDTYNQALFNFKNNFNKVVEFNNFGLGNSNREDVFYFNKNVKGNTGLRGNLSTNFVESLVEEKVVKIIKASDEIGKIIDQNLGYNIILKIDCEGGEYEIFEDLEKNNLLKDISIIMMEWHDKGPEDLEDILKKNKFIYFSNTLNFNSGMIYAINKND